jgi:hypothetical protein
MQCKKQLVHVVYGRGLCIGLKTIPSQDIFTPSIISIVEPEPQGVETFGRSRSSRGNAVSALALALDKTKIVY